MVQSRLLQSGELIKTLCHHVIIFLWERRRADYLYSPSGLLSHSIRERERERDTEEQPPYLKLKLVLQLMLGLSWVAGGIPACSGEARAGFSYCWFTLSMPRSKRWGYNPDWCWWVTTPDWWVSHGEVSVGGKFVCSPQTKRLFMPDLYISGECSHVCLGSTCRVTPLSRELPSVGLLLRLMV